MTHCTPEEARMFAQCIQNRTPFSTDLMMKALRSLADQLEQANLRHIAEFGELQDAGLVMTERERCAKLCDLRARELEAARAHADGTLQGANPKYWGPLLDVVADLAKRIRAAAPAVPAPVASGPLAAAINTYMLLSAEVDGAWTDDAKYYFSRLGPLLRMAQQDATPPQAAPVAQLSEPPAQAEIEALRTDAERYRWLRTPPNNINMSVYGPTGGLLRRDEYLDAAIDVAIDGIRAAAPTTPKETPA